MIVATSPAHISLFCVVIIVGNFISLEYDRLDSAFTLGGDRRMQDEKGSIRAEIMDVDTVNKKVKIRELEINDNGKACYIITQNRIEEKNPTYEERIEKELTDNKSEIVMLGIKNGKVISVNPKNHEF
jgi:hypothetical protein